MDSSGRVSDKAGLIGGGPRGTFRLPRGCLVLAVLSVLCHRGLSRVTPCPAQDPRYLGFVPLAPGTDYPGNDIQYSVGTTLEECLRACITYPGRDCLMVTVTTGGECWLKNAIGPNTAANSHVSGFALPCYVQSTCNTSLCDQIVDLPSVQCQCIPPGDRGFAPTNPFNARFPGNDITWGGAFETDDSAGCVAACRDQDIGCVSALFKPSTRFCNLKLQFVPSNAVPDPEWQAFVNYCALPNNGNCGNDTCETDSLSPSAACREPSEFGFQYLSTNLSFQGMDIIEYYADSTSCVQFCAENPQCMIAQADPSALRCFLKSGANTPIEAPGVVAFQRIGYDASGVTPSNMMFQSMS